MNGWHQYEPGIIGVATQPRFAIGQRAVLMRTAHGNVLWDCISMLDDATVSLIKGARRRAGDGDLASAFLHDR